MDLTNFSATQLLDQLKSGDLSAVDCTEFFLNRIQANRSLNAFVDVGENGSGSLAKSAVLARSFAAGVDAGDLKGPLAGLPIAIKDGICSAGVETTASSRMLERFIPSYDATCVAQLKRCRSNQRWQNQHGRVRDGQLDRKLVLRSIAQSLQHSARARRFQRRISHGSCCRFGTDRTR